MVKVQAEEVSAVQADAQRDLDAAMPALNDAISALDALDKKDITEIKSFSKPPDVVRIVTEAVCVLLGEKADWETSKRVLSDPNFMRRLYDYDKDNIPSATLRKLKRYLEDPLMQIENVSKASSAARSLCLWCFAMDVYAKVAKDVEPKKQRLAEMNAVLDEANSKLKQKQDELSEVLNQVEELQRQCKEMVDEKDRLTAEMEQTKQRLVRAEKLTSSLSTERVRWRSNVETLAIQIEDLVGDVFLASACISYYGPFTGEYRNNLVQTWVEHLRSKNIPCSSTFSLQKVMGDPVMIREWNIHGLPTDDLSINNGILVTRGSRWPLMIDPQSQANKWIKSMESRNRLEVIKITNPNMLRSLENAIPVGRPMLIEDIDETLDPSLDPILLKATFTNGVRTLIHLGDTDIDYNPAFRLYLTTKLPNPHYLPEVCIKVTIINYTVTMKGLEDQLLGDVVKQERPDVEERKNRLVVRLAADKKQLQDIEDRILQMLSEVEGNTLDNIELIQTLGDSKTTSAVIADR